MPLANWKTGEDECLEAPEAQLKYNKLPQDEVESNQDDAGRAVLSQLKWARLLFLGSALLFVLSAGLSSVSFYIILSHSHSGRDCEAEISRHTSFFSPALDNMTPQWSPRLTTQHLLESNESIYRQIPSHDVDIEWNRISDTAVVEITRDQLIRLGKDPATAVKTPPELLSSNKSWQDDDERYLAVIDGMHMLHCLDSMRRSLYHNYHFYYPEGHPPYYGVHLSHCQEMLARWLMCQPSMEFITFGWFEGRDPPFPDFDITHKCVDFEQILDWQDKQRLRGLTNPVFDAYRPPDGVLRRTTPVIYDEYLNHTWDEILGSTERRICEA
ncbi:hypothetical protein EV127DRAFT_493887 [Xylaria flabelliformis]|nr:hypothetical protein EV127DRAFT_493887 [Xylaria flabelliformis]